MRTAAIEVDLQACRLLQADVARAATNATGPVLDDASLLARAVVGAVDVLRRPEAAGGGTASSEEIEIDVVGSEMADDAGTLTHRFHEVRSVLLLRELADRSRSDGQNSSWPTTAAAPAQAPPRIAVLGSTPYGIVAGARTVDASHVAVVTIEGVRRRAVVVSSGELDGIAVRPVGFVTISWIEAVFTERAVYEFLEGIRIELEQLPWRAELSARA